MFSFFFSFFIFCVPFVRLPLLLEVRLFTDTDEASYRFVLERGAAVAAFDFAFLDESQASSS
jgi:hypothetical protein